MKKIVASVGLVAIGASGIQTASAQALGAPDASKPWSISATLRGFYDDNTATVPNNVTLPPGVHRDSFGFEVSPSAALAWSVDQTTVTLGALYSFRHYDRIPLNSTGHNDNTFTFNAGLTHAFNEQVAANVSDSFVIGQEPDLLRAGNTFSTFQRVSGNNIRNHGMIGVDAQLTPEFGIGAGYDNAFYDYKDRGAVAVPLADGGTLYQPSLAGALNRIENRAHLEGTMQIMPETKALIGYQFTDVSYNANEVIGGYLDPFLGDSRVYSKSRDSREHTGYAGIEHNFSPQFKGALRVGASYTDFYNNNAAISGIGSTSWTPYVNGTLRYNYGPLSYVEGGVSYDRNATDVVGAGLPGTTTLDAESAVVYLSLNHAITPHFIASVIGQFQNSKYRGGTYNSNDEQYYLLGLNLEYRFNQYFSTEVGYNYDRLESSSALNRTFDRNRVYIGVTASY
ncbi:MAG TPA: outer membrane beta-barrel protein [Verrucomicrobiae bacterium]|nr:outer membrane beta-barrel protein [Verrucomicrobiae bacterium]